MEPQNKPSPSHRPPPPPKPRRVPPKISHHRPPPPTLPALPALPPTNTAPPTPVLVGDAILLRTVHAATLCRTGPFPKTLLVFDAWLLFSDVLLVVVLLHHISSIGQLQLEPTSDRDNRANQGRFRLWTENGSAKAALARKPAAIQLTTIAPYAIPLLSVASNGIPDETEQTCWKLMWCVC